MIPSMGPILEVIIPPSGILSGALLSIVLLSITGVCLRSASSNRVSAVKMTLDESLLLKSSRKMQPLKIVTAVCHLQNCRIDGHLDSTG